MTANPGRVLSHYRLVEKLGDGGIGVVWRALDTRRDCEVAIKVLPPIVARDDERRARFEEEARAVSMLDHPNIVPIDSIAEADGTYFLCMELIRGETLSDRIPNGGLPLDGLLELALPMVDAIRAAHDKGITHGHLRPGNVMIDQDGRLKVLAFGMAGVREREADPDLDPDDVPTLTLTQERMLPETMPYMSPEQVQGERIDHRSDVFSLGAILYELATGQCPFKGESSADTIVAILRDEPPPVSRLNQALPQRLDEIIARSLDKDRERRYQSVLELSGHLSRLRG